MEIPRHWRLRHWRLGTPDMYEQVIRLREKYPNLTLAQLVSLSKEQTVREHGGFSAKRGEGK